MSRIFSDGTTGIGDDAASLFAAASLPAAHDIGLDDHPVAGFYKAFQAFRPVELEQDVVDHSIEFLVVGLFCLTHHGNVGELWIVYGLHKLLLSKTVIFV